MVIYFNCLTVAVKSYPLSSIMNDSKLLAQIASFKGTVLTRALSVKTEEKLLAVNASTHGAFKVVKNRQFLLAEVTVSQNGNEIKLSERDLNFLVYQLKQMKDRVLS